MISSSCWLSSRSSILENRKFTIHHSHYGKMIKNFLRIILIEPPSSHRIRSRIESSRIKNYLLISRRNQLVYQFNHRTHKVSQNDHRMMLRYRWWKLWEGDKHRWCIVIQQCGIRCWTHFPTHTHIAISSTKFIFFFCLWDKHRVLTHITINCILDDTSIAWKWLYSCLATKWKQTRNSFDLSGAWWLSNKTVNYQLGSGWLNTRWNTI